MNPVCEAIKALRFKHSLTQAELAKKADVPRATVANMESKAANPSITTLVKVAAALGVSIDDLIQLKANSPITEVLRQDMQIVRQDSDKYISTLLSPINAPYIRINDVAILPSCNTRGRPHPKGSHEFFFCQRGEATLKISNRSYVVKAGDLIYFPGNLPHDYANFGKKIVQAISVIAMVEPRKGRKL